MLRTMNNSNGLPSVYGLLLLLAWLPASAQSPAHQELARGLAELIKSERPTTEMDLEKHLKVSLREYEKERLSKHTAWKGITSSPIRTIDLSDLLHTPALLVYPAVDSQTTVITFAPPFCISGDTLQAVLGFSYQPNVIPPTHVHNWKSGTTEIRGNGTNGYLFHDLNPSLEMTARFDPLCSSRFTITKRFRR